MDTTRIPFEAYKGAEPYIFVSYAHKDIDKVFPIIHEFHKTGFPVWYDEGIELGNVWNEDIAKKILDCSLFIVFISPSAAESKNVVREINYAQSKDKPLIHIWLEDTTLNPGLEMQITSNQGIMYFKMEREPEIFYRKCQQAFEKFGIKRAEAGKAEAPANPPEITAQAGAEADFQRGNAYYDGKGVAQDYAEAVRWWRKAAGQGHAGAQYGLGRAYYGGDGVAKDQAETARWWRK
ncbi:MAG: toll/interleukin-1 receptor domain-containing protein, partial [Treponema sp.]|nr:toll/interleukin-1 receptor domain-containing protein [Treponema sp.]